MKQYTSHKNAQTANRDWVVVDLKDKVVGRAATQIADLLRGKHKPSFTPHVDNGDFVVVLNAEKVRFTGHKLDDKIYYHHTGYPGGIRERSARDVRDKSPEELVESAVWGMLPKNKLSRHLMKKLKIYAGSEHPHASQNPKTLELEG